MNKKDYELIARVMNVAYSSVTVRERDVLNSVVRQLATALKADNKRFDSVKFILACGGINV